MRSAGLGTAFLFLTALLLVPGFLCAPPSRADEPAITGYRSVFLPCTDGSGALRVAIRRYEAAGRPFVLLVDPATLETAVAPLASVKLDGSPADLARVRTTPYGRALARFTSPPYKLQNHGATRAERPVSGMFLTVDMCPSRRPFEREFFTAVAALSRKSGRATPLAIAMTGSWLENHGDELAWIVRQVREGKLAVTWVNHSYTHPYEPGTPLERNFLLTPGVDVEREVLATERLMLEKGLVPSPFFRFPGLVADGRLVEQLRRLSLIPIGSDAWLAKGESPRNGSFILVHGNGNEPPGIRKILPMLGSGNDLRLLPLGKAFTGTE